jgi:hypothetical protein
MSHIERKEKKEMTSEQKMKYIGLATDLLSLITMLTWIEKNDTFREEKGENALKVLQKMSELVLEE